MIAHTLVQKRRNYRTILRDDGWSYGDYVEQLASPLVLKMPAEQNLDFLGKERSPRRKRQPSGLVIITAGIVADLEAAQEQFSTIEEDLKS